MKKVISGTLKQLGILIGGIVAIFGCMVAIFAPFTNPKWFIFSGMWVILMYGGLFFYNNYIENEAIL